MIEEDSAGFVEAFTAAVRPHETRGRPARWMLLIAFAIAFAVTLGSLLNGAFGGSGSSSGAGGTSVSALLAATGVATVPTGTGTGGAASKPAMFTAVAGPSCTDGATSFTEAGFSTSGSAAWTTSATGGYQGDDCAGGYVSLPVSGSANALDGDRYALWTFTLGSGLTHASCLLQTYVPDSSSPASVGGAPAYYYYYGSAYTTGSSATPLGDYTVNQTTSLSRWVATDVFTVTSGKVSVRMVDVGTDRGAGAAGIVRDAAAQVRLTCAGS